MGLGSAFHDQSVKSVKATKVNPKCRLWDVNLSDCPNHLQWRKEQTCLFVDSAGKHQKYQLHLPIDFDHVKSARHLSGMKPWPLLLYLHGSGGGSFFTHGKKQIKSVGLQFAAENFVIVS